MKNVSPSSFSYLANNKHEASDCSWLQPGGTGFSIDQLFSSHKIAHGADPSGLGRWSTSHTVLKRLACKLSLYKGDHSDLSGAILHLQQAYRQYRAVKKLAPSWRDSFNQGLVDALLAEGKPHNQHASQIRARMRRERLQRELGLAARSIRGRVNKSAVLRAIAVGHDCVEQVLESQSTMVPAMAESNVRRQQ